MKKSFMKLAWNYDGEASGYDLYKVENNERKLIVSILDQSITELAIPMPEEETEYQIFSIDLDYKLNESSCRKFRSPSMKQEAPVKEETPAPEVPVERITILPEGIQVKWSQKEEAEEYVIFRKSEQEPWTKIGTVSALEFVDEAYEVDTPYSYIVKAVSKDSFAALPEEDAKGTSFTCLQEPVITNAVYYNDYVDVQWRAVPEAALYRVYKRIGKARWMPVGITEKNYIIDADIVPGKTYRYTVRCVNADGNSYTSLFDRTGFEVTC